MNIKESLKEQATEIHELLSIYIKVHDSIFKKWATVNVSKDVTKMYFIFPH